MNATTTIRLALLLDMLGWAWVLARPGDTFGISSAYEGMASMASEDTWAVLFVALAAAMAVTWRTRWLRAAVAFLVGALLAWMALSFGRNTGWHGTGTVTQGVLTYLAWSLLGEDVQAALRG